MNINDPITQSVAEAVKKVVAGKKENAKDYKPSRGGSGADDFIDLHSIDKEKRRGSEPLTEKDIEEANEFTKAAAKAAVAGDKEFEFDGKTYPTEMDVEVAKKILGEEKKSDDLEESSEQLDELEVGPSANLNYEEDEELDEAITQIAEEENLDVDSLSEEQLDELIGKALKKIGSAIKSRVTTSGRAARATKKADKADKKKADRERLAKAKRRLAIQKAQKRKALQKKRAAKARLRREESDVEESTAAYRKSLEKIAKDRQLKNLSKKDRDTLAKIADLLKRANEAIGKEEGSVKEYVGPALTPANQIAKKHGGKVKSIMVKDDKGKKSKYFYVEDEEIEEAVNFSDVEKVMKWAKKNIKAKKFEIDKKNKIAFIDIGPNNVFMLHTMRRGELYVVHDTRGYSGKSGTAKEYEFTKDNAAEEVIKLISKILGIKEDTLEEAIDPRKFALGGNTKATKRDVDAILSKLFLNAKLAKQVEDSEAYKAGFKSKGKGKNPYKKDTADFHLYILGQQAQLAG